MAKKLNDPRKGIKNLGNKQRGLGMLINPEPEPQQKEKLSNKEFDSEDVKIYSLRILTEMFVNRFCMPLHSIYSTSDEID